jgi:hypothetical protein
VTLTVKETRVGEVVEARTAEFVAQAYELDGAPPFGSLVRVGDGRGDVYGFVCQVSSGSLDAGRRVSARGRSEESEDALFENNPELSSLLRTEFSAIVTGFREGDVLVQRLPAQPPRLHGFVHRCDDEELRRFARRLDFLGTLLGTASRCPIDELVGAALRQSAAVQPDPRGYLVAAGKRLTTLLANDVRRLTTILRCAQQ